MCEPSRRWLWLAVVAGALAPVVAGALAPRAARADDELPVVEPEPEPVSEPEPVPAAAPEPEPFPAQSPPASRPKFEAALGLGASFDGDGLTAGVSPVPSFFVTGGFGEGIVGLDLGAFVNSASGRFRSPNLPVDRLALDVSMAVRPFADRWPDDPRYSTRIARALAIDLGIGVERASRLGRAPESVYRFGTCLGLHVDLPLTAPAAKSDLRLRLAARRFVGASHVTFPEGDAATDTRGEIFGALATVF